MSACRHLRKEMGRVIGKGGVCHVLERCLDCHANARGPGVWVPHGQIPVRVDSLPVFADHRTPEERGEQPLLF